MKARFNHPLAPLHNAICKDAGGTYTARAPNGMRASSTSSADAAIGRLVDKIAAKNNLPIGELRARLVPADPVFAVALPVGVTYWLITGSTNPGEAQ